MWYEEPIHEIFKGLYISDSITARNPIVHKLYNITHILNVGDPAGYEMEKKLDNIIVKYINVLDSPNEKIEDYFDECHSFIDSAGEGNVLVHCWAGISRSPTIVISYIMKKFDYTYLQAYYHVKGKRTIIDPNIGFTLTLQDYEKKLKEKIYPMPDECQ